MYSNLAVEILAIDNLVVHTLDCINSLGEKEQAREQEWLWPIFESFEYYNILV